MSDATIFLRDIAGDAASSAANRVAPSEDELSQLDRPAESNTWHDVPDMANLKNQARNQFNKQKPVDRNDMRDITGEATQTAHPGGSRDPRDAARMAANDAQNDQSSGMDGRAGAQAGINQLKDRASANVPEETKDRARHYRDQANDYLHKKLPQERREQGIYRLKKMIAEIQGHQDCMCRGVWHPISHRTLTTTQINGPSTPCSTWPRPTRATARIWRSRLAAPFAARTRMITFGPPRPTSGYV